MRVARWAENINAYGWGPCRDDTVVMARCVALFSTTTRQVLEVVVGRYDEGECAQLLRTLGVLRRRTCWCWTGVIRHDGCLLCYRRETLRFACVSKTAAGSWFA